MAADGVDHDLAQYGLPGTRLHVELVCEESQAEQHPKAPLCAALALSREQARQTGAHCRESRDDVVEVANPVVAADPKNQPQ